MRHKETSIQVKTGSRSGLAEGEFIAYPSTFTREPDAYGDIVAPGAFLETIAAWQKSGDALPVLYGHRMDDPDMILGSVLDQGEDDHGWWIKGQFDLESPKAAQVWRLVKGRRLTKLSFAYDTIDEGQVELEDGRKANELRRVRVYEASFVPVPANPDTSVVAVKTHPATRRIAAQQNNHKLEKTTIMSREGSNPWAGRRYGALDAAQAIIDKAAHEGRDLTDSEAVEIAEHHDAVKTIDATLEESRRLQEALDGLGNPRGQGAKQGRVTRLSFKGLGPRMATGMLDYSRRVGLSKGLVPAGESVIAIMPQEVSPLPSAEGERPPRLLDVLPSAKRPAAYSYLRQAVVGEPGAAGVVAPGELKPTKRLNVRRTDDRLRVVAVLSEPVDRFLLDDETSLNTWVAAELADAVLSALEDEILNGDGTGEHFTGLANTSGIQTQPFVTDPLVTVRHGLSKLQTLGIDASTVALSATDWLAIQTTRNASGGFDVGGPIDATAQTAWGIPVVVVPGLDAGAGWVIGADTILLSYDHEAALRIDWGTPGDAFTRNQLVGRVEGRFNLDVLRPHGVVQLDLSAGA
ncbi:MAG: HK97 family phage prohead protease [Propionibacterium sp.]|nr:HK97 family phage prohead protease [Propionibacterium sp.]